MNAIPTLTIRLASAADALIFRDLRLEALRLHPTIFADTYENLAGRPDAYWHTLLEGMIESRRECVALAFDGERPAGMAAVRGMEKPRVRHKGTLWGVFVRPDYRGRRLTERLVEACLDWSRAAGLRYMNLEVLTTNPAAIRAYLRCGFSVYGVEPAALSSDGVDFDELMMVRRL